MKENYKIKLGLFALGFLALANMGAQITYSFTAAGAIGRFGPSQTQINSAYLSTNLSGSVVSNAGIQTFTIQPGVYRIAAFGAQGGTSTLSTGQGGLGARMEGDFTITATSTLNILVGQQGEVTGYNTGGGGGTFVWINNAALPLIVAGGGGGAGYSTSGVSSPTTSAGTMGVGAAGTPGTGGNGANPGGGGWFTAGANFTGASCTPKCSGNAAGVTVGGATPTTAIVFHGCAGTDQTGDGGFGGGSGGNGNCTTSYGGGGGGGYSGGVGQSGATSGGGGGGSYNSGSNQLNMAGFNSGDGKVVITEQCPIRISSSSTGTLNPTILCAGNSLTLSSTAVSNYSWSTGQTGASIVVAPTTNTFYTLIATSSLNCTSYAAMNIIVSNSPPVLSISNPSNTICLGRTVSLTATGAITYTWTNPGVVNGQTFTPTSTQAYTVSGQNGCGITVATTTITVAPLPVSTLASPTLVCQGYPSTLTAIASVGGYTWQPGPLMGNTVVAAPLANTVYTVTASDGTCAGTATVLVTTKTTPTITTSQTLSTICEGQSVTLSASGAGTGGTYVWSPGGPGPSITLTPPTSTNVTVSGTNTLNCTSSAQQIIIVNSPPPLVVSANKTLVCSGDPIVLTGSGANGYQWTGGPGTANYTVNPTTALSVYTVTGTHTTNICTISKTIAVSAIIPNVQYSSTLSVCEGGSLTFTASGASTYTWNGFNTGSSGTYVNIPTGSSIYTLIANTNSLSVNCLTTHYASVTVNPNPTVTVSPGKETICKGETHTLTASGASTYSWSTSGTSSVITVKPNTTTSYTVTGYTAAGCESTFVYMAKVNNCTALTDNTSIQNIAVYPNPSNGEFEVSCGSDITLNVVNSIGQTVRSLSLNNGNNHKAEVKDLSNGVYFIVGENNEGKVNQKIVVSK